jgi:hypothetical protein
MNGPQGSYDPASYPEDREVQRVFCMIRTLELIPSAAVPFSALQVDKAAMTGEERGGGKVEHSGKAGIKVIAPDIGEGYFPEKVISVWYVQDGGLIDFDAPLFEVSTDKVQEVIPSPAAGRVEILAPAESMVRAGEVVAIIHPLASPV